MDIFLKHIQQRISLTLAEETHLLSKLKQRTYLKNQYIVQAGDICKHQTFVISGKVRTFYLDDNGNEHIVLSLTPFRHK